MYGREDPFKSVFALVFESSLSVVEDARHQPAIRFRPHSSNEAKTTTGKHARRGAESIGAIAGELPDRSTIACPSLLGQCVRPGTC